MPTYLEHANICVPDIDAAIRFLKLIDPAFVVRHDEVGEGGYRWAHVGNDQSYVALEEARVGSAPEAARTTYANYGVNHLGWVVDDLEAVAARLDAAGCRRGTPNDDHPHRRRTYYFDDAGQEWEIVQYLSDAAAQRNDYAR